MARETENFLTNLRLLCEQHGAIARMARNGEIHYNTIYRIVAGERLPTIETAEKIAHASGLQLRSMLLPPDEFCELISAKFLQPEKAT